MRRGQEEGGKIARLREAGERVEQSRQNVAAAEGANRRRRERGQGSPQGAARTAPEIRVGERWPCQSRAQAGRASPSPRGSKRHEVRTGCRRASPCRAPQIAAARIEPPSYIVRELGERPADPVKRESWDRGVRKIESYRQEHGVTHRSRAFGTRPQERSARKAAERSLRRVQRELGLKRQLARARQAERGIGRGIGR